jgi:hypothetical protein
MDLNRGIIVFGVEYQTNEVSVTSHASPLAGRCCFNKSDFHVKKLKKLKGFKKFK